uniref:type IV toxin-antitoxin system AbiEi family antitoxin domain-containing protein n=1 Tax=Actinokineospora sp. CA-119265 TaxID=3239890 RepID=UPI003F492F33
MELARAVKKLGAYTAEQWGLVTTAQARSTGVDNITLTRLAQADLLERVQQGCYLSTAVGEDSLIRERVAWLMLAPSVAAWSRPALDRDGGVLSHATAAYVNGWGDLQADTVTISVPRRRVSRHEDIRYLIRDLDEDDVVLAEGLPTTTAERTVADLLVERADGGHVGQIIYDAVRRGQLDVDKLAARVGHLARHYGVARRDGRALVDHLLEQGGHLATELATPQLARPGVSTLLSVLYNSPDGPMSALLREQLAGITTVRKELEGAVGMSSVFGQSWRKSIRDSLANPHQKTVADVLRIMRAAPADVPPDLAAAGGITGEVRDDVPATSPDHDDEDS